MSSIVKGSTPVIVFLMVDSTDYTTAETSLSPVPVVQLSKNGGAFATSTNAATEIGNGWYKATLTATETGTAGPLIVRATATGCAEWRQIYHVLDTSADLMLNDDTILAIAYSVVRADLANARAASGAYLDAETDRSVLGLAAMDVNKTEIDSGAAQLVVYEEDGTTEFFRQDLITTVSTVDPVIGRTPV